MTRTIQVRIPGNIVYVSGTVNDVPKTWTLSGDAWQCIADRSSDDVYHVDLTAVNVAGVSTNLQTTLYYGLHLITDRTQADVDRALYLRSKWVGGVWTGTQDELAEWNADLKGAYNAGDLNRVGAACAYVAARLNDNGYNVTISPKINWQDDEIPDSADMAAYLGNVETLKDMLPIETPELPPNMVHLDYQGANNIERVLELVDDAITRIINSWWYAGEIMAGE